MASHAADASRASSQEGTAPRLVIVEGNISAGKSTLCRELAERLGYALFLEPTVGNPYLEKYYAEPKVYGLPMQMWLLKQRFVTYCQAICYVLSGASHRDQVEGVLLDRSIFSDCVFAEKNFLDGNISKEGYEFYKNQRQRLLSMLPSPDLVLYLDASAETCFDRIHNLRGRNCEGGIPLAYLQGLDDCYQNFLKDMADRGSKVISLPWNTFGDADEASVMVSGQTPAKLYKHVNTSPASRPLRNLVMSPNNITKAMQMDMIDEALGPDHAFAPVADPDALTKAECVVTPRQEARKRAGKVELMSKMASESNLLSPDGSPHSVLLTPEHGVMEPPASPGDVAVGGGSPNVHLDFADQEE